MEILGNQSGGHQMMESVPQTRILLTERLKRLQKTLLQNPGQYPNALARIDVYLKSDDALGEFILILLRLIRNILL